MIPKLTKLAQQKSHLIFDFDKTIAQVEIDWTDWHSGVIEIYSRYDQNHGYEIGMNPHEHFNVFAENQGEDLIQEVKTFISDYEQEYARGFTPYQELIDFIKTNDTNTFFVFSSNARKTVEAGLKQFDLLENFEQLITRDDVRKVKPEAEGFYLLDGFEANKDNYLMIGDSSSDKIAAQKAGIDFLRCDYFGTYDFSGKTK